MVADLRSIVLAASASEHVLWIHGRGIEGGSLTTRDVALSQLACKAGILAVNFLRSAPSGIANL
jgi:hypothetical protein